MSRQEKRHKRSHSSSNAQPTDRRRDQVAPRQKSATNAIEEIQRHMPLILDPMGPRDMVPSHE